jgi:hypothetical protein
VGVFGDASLHAAPIFDTPSALLDGEGWADGVARRRFLFLMEIVKQVVVPPREDPLV